jgi:acyl carrier protein
MDENKLDNALYKAKKRRDLTMAVKKALIEGLNLEYDFDDISEDSPLFGAGLGLDSIDALEIAIIVDREFEVLITDEDMKAFRSINTIVDFIMDKTIDKNLEAQLEES